MSEVRKRPQVSAAFVADFRRGAITEALAELCVEQGYRATTIADIARSVGYGRGAIYELFDNREQIFLTLLDRAISELLAAAQGACRSADPEQRIEATLAAVLDWVVAEPAPAWACLVESTCATEESYRRYFELLDEFTVLLRANLPPELPRPATTEETLIGGVAAILRYRIQSGEATRTPELLQPLSHFLRLPST